MNTIKIATASTLICNFRSLLILSNFISFFLFFVDYTFHLGPNKATALYMILALNGLTPSHSIASWNILWTSLWGLFFCWQATSCKTLARRYWPQNGLLNADHSNLGILAPSTIDPVGASQKTPALSLNVKSSTRIIALPVSSQQVKTCPINLGRTLATLSLLLFIRCIAWRLRFCLSLLFICTIQCWVFSFLSCPLGIIVLFEIDIIYTKFAIKV